jgi:glucokinase
MVDNPYLILDFGGTKLSAANIAPGETVWRQFARRFSGPDPTREKNLSTIFQLARDLLGTVNPRGVGVSFGGPVRFSDGVVHNNPHVAGWEDFPLKKLLETEFGAPVLVDNDANLAALGELHYGAGRGLNSFFYLTVSTGVGSGLILDRDLWRGHEELAGEIGHTVIDPKGPVCVCGKRGCIERFASGPSIVMDVQDQLRDQPAEGSILLELIQGDLSAIDGKVVAKAARMGDAIARARLELAGWALGVGIGNAANLVNPQKFILGGGITKAGARFWENVKNGALETALPNVTVTLLPAELGDDAPLWGAVRLAMEASGES